MNGQSRLKLNNADLERMEQLARRRGIPDITTYVRVLMDADAAHALSDTGNAHDEVASQLRDAGLLIKSWAELDAEIAELAAEGVHALAAPVELPRGARPSESLIDEDRRET